MNNRTANMIEEAKLQTLGVEIEMNCITREKAAKIAAKYFGTGRYEDTHRRNGYCTWSAWDADGREWKFSRDVSISGPDAEKCELVTPILHYDDIPLLQELVRQLRHAGARSDYTRNCGVHAHVGANGHTAQSLRNLVNLMAAHEDLIFESLQIAESRKNHYCQTVDPRFLAELNRRKPKTMSEFADIWYGSQNANCGRTAKYNSSRYHALNLHSVFTTGTVEFRLGQFNPPADGKRNGLHCGYLRSYLQLCLVLSQMAKTVKTASPKQAQRENKKFAMRTWLTRMGFIGDEFKTARDILTRNLDGDAAFRYGRTA